MELYPEQVDLDALIEDDRRGVAPPASTRKGNELVVHADDLGTIEADAQKLRQALLNLLGNAGKFTREGRVTLTVEREERLGQLRGRRHRRRHQPRQSREPVPEFRRGGGRHLEQVRRNRARPRAEPKTLPPDGRRHRRRQRGRQGLALHHPAAGAERVGPRRPPQRRVAGRAGSARGRAVERERRPGDRRRSRRARPAPAHPHQGGVLAGHCLERDRRARAGAHHGAGGDHSRHTDAGHRRLAGAQVPEVRRDAARLPGHPADRRATSFSGRASRAWPAHLLKPVDRDALVRLLARLCPKTDGANGADPAFGAQGGKVSRAEAAP